MMPNRSRMPSVFGGYHVDSRCIGDGFVVEHLPSQRRGGGDKAHEFKGVDGAGDFLYITVDIGADIAGINHPAVGVLPADKGWHPAVPDTLVYGWRIDGFSFPHSQGQLVEIQHKRVR